MVAYQCQLQMFWITDQEGEVISGPYPTEDEALCELTYNNGDG